MRSLLTPEYVSWLVSQILGGSRSIHDYLRRKQVEYAARLLRTTPLSVEEIALRAGFGSRITLYRWFLARYGVPPAVFRELKK